MCFPAIMYKNIHKEQQMFTAESRKLIDCIRDQTEGVPNHLVFVLDIVSCRFGGYFTPDIKSQIQQFPYLQMLTLNDCGIKSLENFPHLPGLIRLDLVFNEITGDSLVNLKGSRHLQTLMLGANKIQKFEHVAPLGGMKQLLQIDLINNPISKLPGYRERIFAIFPSLNIVDTLDKGGKDAYANPSMVQAVSRVPDALFDKSPVIPSLPIFAPHIAPIGAPSKKIADLGLFAGKAPVHTKIEKKVMKTVRDKLLKQVSIVAKSKGVKIGKGGKFPKASSASSTSSRAGIVFPSARIKRRYKQEMPNLRISKTSTIYTAAVLEYMTAELLELAGNEAKTQKKQRITPQILKKSLMKDEEMHRFLQSVTFGMGE